MSTTTASPATDPEWEPLPLHWHEGFAFLDNALLGDASAKDTYIVLDPTSSTPADTACRARERSYRPTPLPPEQKVWRHRAHPCVLRGDASDYYLLDHYHRRYGYYAVQPLAFRFGAGLKYVAGDYWCDSDAAYYLTGDEARQLPQANAAALRAVPAPEAGPQYELPPLVADDRNVYLQGQRIAASTDTVVQTNHPHYLIVNGQVCRFRYGQLRVLHQKNGQPLAITHPERFHMLDWRWGTDGSSVIVQAQQGSSMSYEYFYRIDDADLASFSVLNQRYAKDAKRAYYLTGKVIHPVGEFRLLTCREFRYDAHGAVSGVVREYTNDYFAVDDRYVYAAGTRLHVADGASFRHLGFDYYRDRNHVYQRNKPLEVDAASFVVAQLYEEGRPYNPVLAGDRSGPLGSNGIVDATAFREWAPFFEARPELQDYWWHRLAARQQEPAESPDALVDLGQGFQLGRQVYFHGRPIDGLNASSFRILSPRFCGDAHGLYLIPCYETGVPEQFSTAPVSEFRQWDEHYLSDGGSVFCQSVFVQPPSLLRKADLTSFEALGHGWAKDRHAVYYFGQAKKDLDPARTRVMGCYALSDSVLFCQGKRLDVPFSPEEVSVPHPAFLQLGTRKLFCGRRPISTQRIDLASLQFTGPRHARDRRGYYVYDGYGRLSSITAEEYAAAGAPAGQGYTD